MHAQGEPEEFVEVAIEKGLHEYGIGDHAPVKPEPFDDWRMLYEQLPEYYAWIERARTAAGDRLGVRAGLECDWLPNCQDWIASLRSEYNWDYLIGSVHYIADRWDFDNPVWLGRWAETDVEEVWKQYWQTYAEMVRSGLFDIYAHADLIKKFGYSPTGDLRAYYEPVVQALVDQQGAIEINTAGWHKPCEEQYPAIGFLKMCAEAGVSLVISSDAHAPAEVARDFESAISLAKSAGFTSTVSIQQGKKTEIPLG